MSEQGIVVKESEQFKLLAGDELKHSLEEIRKFQNVVKSLLTPGLDFGTIPGTGNKPTLLKPGAEKLAKMHMLSDEYIIVDKVENWDKVSPFFHYTIKCQLRHIPSGKLIAEGMGEANSMESKFRYRWIFEKDLPAGIDKEVLVRKEFDGKYGGKFSKFRIDNDDICSQVNTILKMGKKRGLVDAVLSAVRLSAVFTQDIEDIVEAEVEEKEPVTEAKQDTPGETKAVTSDEVTVKLNDEIGELAKKAGLDGQGISNVIYSVCKKSNTEGLDVATLQKVVSQFKKVAELNAKQKK